jgi:dihydroflavonol-4-reductase
LIGKSLTGIVWRLERIRSFFTGNAPLITKETALSSSHSFEYQTDKIKQTLSFSFRNLEESLDRICKNLLVKSSRKS